MLRLTAALAALAFLLLPASHAPAEEAPKPSPLACSIDFEGGSGIVESIDQQARMIQLRPSEHKDRGWDCWWFVKVSGIRPGETIGIDMGGRMGNWSKPERAAFSLDGKTWRRTAPGTQEGKRIAYRQKIDAEEAFFAWGPPFLPGDAKRLVDRAAGDCRWAEAFELCRSREGRSVPALRVVQPGASDAERFGVWINARQHAWESGSSWVAQGLIDWLISEDPRAQALRKRAAVTVVPIMDVDNVARGAGGKMQKPHDHNRDWCDDPHWPEVRAAIAAIRQMDAAGRFDLYLDLHNPGKNDKRPFFYLPGAELMGKLRKVNMERMIDAVRAEMAEPMKLADRMKQSGPGYDPNWRKISGSWVAANTQPHVVGLCLETPWDTPHSTIGGYRTVGRQLGLAVERYLRQNPRKRPDEAR